MEGEIEIPENINSYTVTKIGKDAFSSNDKITAVKLPNTIETIEKHAFSWCDSLNSIVIPLSIKTIEEDAFYSTHTLTDIYYNGTADDWNKVYNQKNSTNEVNIHFNE